MRKFILKYLPILLILLLSSCSDYIRRKVILYDVQNEKILDTLVYAQRKTENSDYKKFVMKLSKNKKLLLIYSISESSSTADIKFDKYGKMVIISYDYPKINYDSCFKLLIIPLKITIQNYCNCCGYFANSNKITIDEKYLIDNEGYFLDKIDLETGYKFKSFIKDGGFDDKTFTSESIKHFIITPDNKYIITDRYAGINRYRYIRVWDFNTGELIKNLIEKGTYEQEMKYDIDLSKDGTKLFDGLNVWDLNTFELVKQDKLYADFSIQPGIWFDNPNDFNAVIDNSNIQDSVIIKKNQPTINTKTLKLNILNIRDISVSSDGNLLFILLKED